MWKRILDELAGVKKELQNIRRILEQSYFIPEDSSGKHYVKEAHKQCEN